jgi:hypothetical protein
MIVIEDDANVRKEIQKRFEESALKVFCAQDYEAAKRLIYHPRLAHASPFRYAIIDDYFPRRRGEQPQYLAENVVDILLHNYPEMRLFGYVEREEPINGRYVRILTKERCSVDELYEIIINDAEMELA